MSGDFYLGLMIGGFAGAALAAILLACFAAGRRADRWPS
jgi:hypothetical protein